MGFHVYVPRISALSENLRNEKRLLIKLEEQIDRFEDDPRSEDWRTEYTERERKSILHAWLDHCIVNREISPLLDFAFPKSYISASQEKEFLGTDGAPLGDATFPPFVPIKVKDAVAIPMVTTPDTNGRAAQGEKLVNQQLNWTNTALKALYSKIGPSMRKKFPLPKGAHLDRMKAHLMDAQNSRSRIFLSRHLGLGKQMTNRCHGKKDYRRL